MEYYPLIISSCAYMRVITVIIWVVMQGAFI